MVLEVERNSWDISAMPSDWQMCNMLIALVLFRCLRFVILPFLGHVIVGEGCARSAG